MFRLRAQHHHADCVTVQLHGKVASTIVHRCEHDSAPDNKPLGEWEKINVSHKTERGGLTDIHFTAEPWNYPLPWGSLEERGWHLFQWVLQ